MNVNYKMMGVVLCGAMLLASGCGAKAETTASSAVESESGCFVGGCAGKRGCLGGSF